MYSWGPSDPETWKNPKGYDYGSAKAPYLETLKKEADEKGEKSYLKKSAPNLKLVDPKGRNLYSASKNPIIVGVDGTGSMQTWPGEFYDRAALFYQTLSKYREDIEISFSVIGDAISDKYALQAGNFEKGPAIDDIINALYPEGAGGPGIRESYELWAYFMNTHVQTPNAISPIMLLMGDEKFYDKINPEHVKQYLGGGLQEKISSMEVWKQLSQKFDIYLLRKSYAGRDEEITSQWKEAIGEQRIIPIYDPMRAVDVAMGLIAKKWGYSSDFKKNLSARQDSKGIKSVMDSLRTAPDLDLTDTKSKIKGSAASKKGNALTGEEK